VATLTDYLVLRDASFEIDAALDSERGFEFSLDADFTAGTALARPLVAFIVNPLSDGARMEVVVASDPGGTEGFFQKLDVVSTLGFGGDPAGDRGLWEAFSGTLLTPGARNAVTFRALEGRLRLRDVVLWHQRAA
jgi:hypothetical protein